jgi:hypothetical protein
VLLCTSAWKKKSKHGGGGGGLSIVSRLVNSFEEMLWKIDFPQHKEEEEIKLLPHAPSPSVISGLTILTTEKFLMSQRKQI